MKRLSVLFCLTFLSALSFGQGASFSRTVYQNSGGNIPRVVPNAPVLVCNYPATGGTPCTNLATTYNSPANNSACALGQVTLPTTSTCSNTADAVGNFDVFVASGTYAYYWENGSTWNGPYTFVAGAGNASTGISGAANTLAKILGGGTTVGSSDISDSSLAITILNSASVSLAAASSVIPCKVGAGIAPTTDGTCGYDSTAHQFKFGANGVSSSLLSSNIAPTPNAAGGLALGSVSLPWSGVIVGASANNTANLTGTFTANRTITIPDASTTLAGLSISNTWSAGTQDMTAAAHTLTIKSGTAAAKPASCTFTAGAQMEIYLATDATAGQNMYFCTASNTWTQMTGGGGGNPPWNTVQNPASNQTLSMGTTTTAWTWGNTTTSTPFTLTFGALTGSPTVPQLSILDTTGSTLTGPLVSIATQGTSTAQGLSVSTNGAFTAATFSAGSSTSYAIAVPFGKGNIGFNRLVSTSTNAPTSGCSICFGATDAIKYWNGALSQAMILVQGGGSGPIQVGDVNGAGFPGPITGITAGANLTIRPLAASGAIGGDLILNGGSTSGAFRNGFVRLAPGSGGTGGNGYIDIGGSAVSFSYTNDSTNPVGAENLLVALTPQGTVSFTTAGSTNGALGICVGANCASGGATVSVAFEGIVPLVMDGAATVGDYVTISSSQNGEGHDAGLSQPAGQQIVGQVSSFISGTTYNIVIGNSISGGSSSSANAVVTNPSANQTIQATNSSATSLIVKCASGAGNSQNCFQLLDKNGNNILAANQSGQITFGTGTNGSMTIGSVSAAFFQSTTAGTLPNSGVLRLATSDQLCWENFGQTGTICISKNSSDSVVFPALNPGTSSIIAFATTNPVNFVVSNPAATRNITFPDPGGNDSVAYLAATQTFSNKTFGDSITMNNAAAGSNPAAGFSVLRIDSTTGQLACLSGGVGTTGAGSSCMPAGGGGSRLDQITAATGSNTISNLDNAQTWKWTLTTAAKSAFQFTENAAAINGAGAQFLVNINTLAASTASPLQVTARGTSNGFVVDPATGNLKLIGSALLDYNTGLASVVEVSNSTVGGTGANLLAKLTTSNCSGAICAVTIATSDTAGIEGIIVAGNGTSGNAQIAHSGFGSCVFDGATTANDYVIASTTVAGNCHDIAFASLTGGQQIIGRVLSTNVGGGTYLVDLSPRMPVIPAVGATNGLTLTFSNGVMTIDLPQALKTNSNPTFGKVLLPGGGSIQGTTGTASLTFQSGTDANSSQGNTTLRGGDMTGTSNSSAGNTTVRGGNSASTNAGQAAGQLLLQPGQATVGAAAGPNNGQLLVEGAYVKGVTYTVGNVQCFSADNTVGDCVTSSTAFIGVAITSNSNSALVALEGSQVTVNYDATVSPSAGWHACMSTTVTGKVLAQSGDCSSHQQIGIIEKAGTNVTSGPITIRMR